MLNDKLRHYLPCFSGGSVGVVSSVDLKDVRPRHDLLGFAGVYERSYAVDVSVEYIVLRVLVSSVYAFFGEQNGYVRTGNA